MMEAADKRRQRQEVDEAVNAYLKLQPITEQSNRLTSNIDMAENGRAVLDLLERTDREILDGWQLPEAAAAAGQVERTLGLRHDRALLDKLARLAELLAEQMRRQMNESEEQFRLVLSGCGTSGRLAYLCSQTMNDYYQKRTGRRERVCEYVIAGEDFALVNSVESVEDKPHVGAEKLREIIYRHQGDGASKRRVVFVGITCGLSAPFVAGQLDYCLNGGDANVLAAGIVGFNTVEMTRRTNSINARNETFHELMAALRAAEAREPARFFVLNPLIGPEPVTGSSRMKSGSATKIMLDMVATSAFDLLFDEGAGRSAAALQARMLDLYERAMTEVVYEETTKARLGLVVDAARESLAHRQLGGSVNYLADSVRLGFIGCVDASECVPTYGAAKRDIRGFVAARAPACYLGNADADPEQAWFGFVRTCTSTWSQRILNELGDEFNSKHCTLVLINDADDTSEGAQDLPDKQTILERLRASSSEAKVFRLDFSYRERRQEGDEDEGCFRRLPSVLRAAKEAAGDYFAQCLQELVLKLAVNAISTGAHVLIGKTYENIMIDVRVSNIKLYWRAVGIIARFAALDTTESAIDVRRAAEDLLLRAIYGLDDTASLAAVDRTDVEAHIAAATEQQYVVPKALMMAITKCTYTHADRTLSESKSSVRNCIFKQPQQ